MIYHYHWYTEQHNILYISQPSVEKNDKHQYDTIAQKCNSSNVHGHIVIEIASST